MYASYLEFKDNAVFNNTYDAYIDGLHVAQDCSNSIANALELLQSCTKPSMYGIDSLCPVVQ